MQDENIDVIETDIEMEEVDLDAADSVNEDEEIADTPKTSFFGTVSFALFILTVFLLPLWILPAKFNLLTEVVKKGVFTFGVLGSFGFWLLAKLSEGKIALPGKKIVASSVFVLLAVALSSYFAPNQMQSVVGLGYENDTLVGAVLFFMAMYLAFDFFKNSERTFYFYVSLISSLLISGLVEVIQVLSGGSLVAGGSMANLIGNKWNDVGVLFGLGAVLSVAMIELFRLNKMSKRIAYALLVVSTVVVAIVNYNLVWAMVGLFALATFAYDYVFAMGDSRDEAGANRGFLRNLLRPSVVLVVLSIVFFVWSADVGTWLNAKYGVTQFEVRPSWQSTVDVSSQVLAKNLWLGSGPNTFASDWGMYKPDAVNYTQFWNLDFEYGFGRLLTSAATTGVLGALAWAIFLLLVVYYGLRVLFMRGVDSLSKAGAITVTLATLYLWVFSTFYFVHTSVTAITFMMTGAMFAYLCNSGIVSLGEISLSRDSRFRFVSVLLLTLLVLSTLTGSYVMARKFYGIYNFQNAVATINAGDIVKGEQYLKTAIVMDSQDVYQRTYSQLGVMVVNNTLSQFSQLKPNEADRAKALGDALKTSLSLASGYAQMATDANKANYLNWAARGAVAEAVVPFKSPDGKALISGAYEQALESYKQAALLAPKNPSNYFSLARLEVANGSLEQARNYLGMALTVKPNYTEALYMLAQIEVKQGNVASAIGRLDNAVVFAPNDAGLFFQLGFLKYQNRDVNGAIDALKKAVAIQTNYSNAKYFLGLSYSKIGQVDLAIKEFEDIQKLNQDNQEVKTILKNLKSGNAALEGLLK